jgi:hypothetical protein
MQGVGFVGVCEGGMIGTGAQRAIGFFEHVRRVEHVSGVAEGDQTWPRLTLLVKSKTRGKAVLPRTCERQGDRVHSFGDTHAHGVGDYPSRLNQQSHDFLDTSGDLRRLTRGVRTARASSSPISFGSLTRPLSRPRLALHPHGWLCTLLMTPAATNHEAMWRWSWEGACRCCTQVLPGPSSF